MKFNPPTNRLRVWRAERRTTQMALAVKARISMSRYWKIENGYAIPTETEVSALVRALKVSAPHEIFPGHQSAPEAQVS